MSAKSDSLRAYSDSLRQEQDAEKERPKAEPLIPFNREYYKGRLVSQASVLIKGRYPLLEEFLLLKNGNDQSFRDFQGWCHSVLEAAEIASDVVDSAPDDEIGLVTIDIEDLEDADPGLSDPRGIGYKPGIQGGGNLASSAVGALTRKVLANERL